MDQSPPVDSGTKEVATQPPKPPTMSKRPGKAKKVTEISPIMHGERLGVPSSGGEGVAPKTEKSWKKRRVGRKKTQEEEKEERKAKDIEVLRGLAEKVKAEVDQDGRSIDSLDPPRPILATHPSMDVCLLVLVYQVISMVVLLPPTF